MTDPGRLYAGRSENERRADRRTRLLAAGLELFGTEGWTGTTIERICSSASVATRSFYEEFASREALLLAVFEAIMSGVVAEVVPRVTGVAGAEPSASSREEQIRTGLGGYVTYLTADPRRARVVHHEIKVAGSLEKQRQAMAVRFAELIATQARLEPPRGHLLGLALAGAVSEVLVDWVTHPEPRPDTGPLVDVLVDVYVSALARA